MPSLGCHVPEDSPLYASAQKRAEERHAGKVSAYVRSLVERDLAGSAVIPPPADPRFLEKLYAAVLPSRVSRFQRLWDARMKLAHEPATQSEIVELMLRAYLAELEAAPITSVVDAFDASPGLADALRKLAENPNIVPYAQPEESAQHVAEDQSAPGRTGRTLPHKPPKPKSTGTTP